MIKKIRRHIKNTNKNKNNTGSPIISNQNLTTTDFFPDHENNENHIDWNNIELDVISNNNIDLMNNRVRSGNMDWQQFFSDDYDNTKDDDNHNDNHKDNNIDNDNNNFNNINSNSNDFDNNYQNINDNQYNKDSINNTNNTNANNSCGIICCLFSTTNYDGEYEFPRNNFYCFLQVKFIEVFALFYDIDSLNNITSDVKEYNVTEKISWDKTGCNLIVDYKDIYNKATVHDNFRGFRINVYGYATFDNIEGCK